MLLGILLALIIIICIAMVGVILLQKSEGGALGMSGGGPGAFMTARGAGDLLTTTTQVLAAMFFALCLIMTMLSGHNRNASVTDKLKLNGIAPPSPVAPAQTGQGGAGQAEPSQTAPASGPAPIPGAPLSSQAPSGQVGIFGEAEGRAKPAASSNPLSNITVQSSAPPARH